MYVNVITAVEIHAQELTPSDTMTLTISHKMMNRVDPLRIGLFLERACFVELGPVATPFLYDAD